jgi:hypothetical protein
MTPVPVQPIFLPNQTGSFMTTEIPTLTQRKLQAQVIGPFYAEMVVQIGEERAALILDKAIRKAAVAEGQYFAEKAGGQTSMADFIQLYEHWTPEFDSKSRFFPFSPTRP